MLMSVIVANDSSGGSTSGSINEATAASSPSSPSPEGKKSAPQRLPPLVSPAPRKVNGAAAEAAAAAAGRSDNLTPDSIRRNNSKQGGGRKPQQQQESEGEKDEDGEKKWGGPAGGTNMTSPSLNSEQQLNSERQQREHEMRRLGKKGMWREALAVLASIPEPSQRQFVAAIAACDFSGEPRQAFRMHALMVEQGLKPTAVRS